MVKIIRCSVLLAMLLILSYCGHRKPPTGGPVDTEKPTVVSVTPEPYSLLNQGIIEITFSKPIDRSSIYAGRGGVYIYPVINEKKFRWLDSNTLRVEFDEELKENSNYYLSISQSIRDLRRNELNKDYLYIFHTGKLTNNRIGGTITYEREEDSGSEISFTLMSADSVRIFSKKVKGDRYNIEYLDERDHIVRAYIDKNNNKRYDIGREPFFQKSVLQAQYREVSLHMEYFDDTKPEIRTAHAPFNNQIRVNMNKPVVEIGEIKVSTADSLHKELEVFSYDFLDETIEIITAAMDSVKYEVTLLAVKDGKNNKADSLWIDFNPSITKDTQPLTIVENFPRNGAVVETVNPALRVKFSKHIYTEDIIYSVVDTMTGSEIPFDVHRIDSRQFMFVPVSFLAGRQTYKLVIREETADVSGNKLEETFELNFLPIAE